MTRRPARFPFSRRRRPGRRQAGAAARRRRAPPRRRAAAGREGLGQDDAGPGPGRACCPATRRSSSCRSAPPRTGSSARSTSPPLLTGGEAPLPARPAGRGRTAACSTSTRSTCWPTTWSTCCSTWPSSGVNRVERDGLSHTPPGPLRAGRVDEPRGGRAAPAAARPLRAGRRRGRARATRRRGPRPCGAGWRFDADAGRRSPADVGRPPTASCAPRLAAPPARRPSPDDVVERGQRGCAVGVGAEGLRADLVLCRAAAALAALGGPDARPTVDDLRPVAPLVLAHRRRRRALRRAHGRSGRVDRILDELPTGRRLPTSRPPTRATPAPTRRLDRRRSGRGEVDAGGGPPDPPTPGPGRPTRRGAPERPMPAAPLRPAGGSRPTLPTVAARQRRRGRLVGAEPVAAGRGRRPGRRRHRRWPRLERPGWRAGPVAAADLRQARRRVGRPATSWCSRWTPRARWAPTAAWRRPRAPSLGLLVDAYQRRDRVALVSVRGEGAEVVLRPTASVEVARTRLVDCPPAGPRPWPTGARPPSAWPRAPGGDAGAPPAAGRRHRRPGHPRRRGADPVAAARAAAERSAVVASTPWSSTPRTTGPAWAWPPIWPPPWAPST